MDPGSRKRKHPGLGSTVDAKQNSVTDHYNALPAHTREGFGKSPIFQLKSLNSWAKAMLICKYVKDNDRVLELCAGKSGDAAKYDNRDLCVDKVVWIDVAANSIKEAHQRITTDKKKGRRRYECEFFSGDCFQLDLHDAKILNNQVFDVVSCQMAFHYCFETRRKARIMMYNIAKSLKVGGVFIGTLPYYNNLRKRFAEPFFKNSIVSVQYQVQYPSFGARYVFNLKTAIHGCAEYLVHMETLKKLGKEFGLEFIENVAFHKWYASQIQTPKGADLWRMLKLPEQSRLDRDQWTTHGLYSVMAFKRVAKELPAADTLNFSEHNIVEDPVTGIKDIHLAA
jgi:mRNA (guanine-N7-)-methyltransferase